mmetsp:Transcript_10828/g.15859  ORF Transcript_10828/g.15859 Transcript_10828/m.15859 type:complete len:179 (+) Transcript_10828:35-571(+)
MFISTITAVTETSPFCASSASFFGFMGAAIALVFSNLGSAYGTAKSGVGLMHLGVMNPKLTMKGIIPSIMAGIMGIYGLIVSSIIGSQIDVQNGYSGYKGYAHLASGLSVGLSSLAAGMTIGIVGDAGVRAFGKQQSIFVALILIMIFAEAFGLYGLIVALIIASINKGPTCPAPKVE